MLLPPRFQPVVRLFNVCKKPRVFERGPPDWHDRSHAVPHHPDLAVAFEKQLIINQSVRTDARPPLPIAEHHADVCVLPASLRVFLHHVFRGCRMKVFHKPRTRLPQPRLSPHVIESQHQVDFVIAHLRHVVLLAPVRGSIALSPERRPRRACLPSVLPCNALPLKLYLNAPAAVSAHLAVPGWRGRHVSSPQRPHPVSPP